jgi:hypothetical protein
MTSKQDLRQRLEAQRERILTAIAKDTARAGRVFDGLGHGYAMRAYSRLKKMSHRVGDELSERLEAVEKELKALGWYDPRKPVEAERTEEEQMRHYCEVMGLRYEEEMAKRNAPETAEVAQ